MSDARVNEAGAADAARVETLVEYADSRGLRPAVDLAAGLITGVKVLGLKSRNGRVYAPEAIRRAAALYEGVKVNVNHPRGAAAAPRDYQDRLGHLQNIRVDDSGLYGDLRFNPKHAIAEQLAWDANHAPESVGLSHNVRARTSRRGGEVLVEEILSVNSVDLVADPATTHSLFESSPTPPASGEPSLEEQIGRLAQRLDRLETAASTPTLEALLTELSPPAEALSEAFLHSLGKLDLDTARRLILERVELFRAAEAGHGRPKSKGPEAARSAPLDVAQSARAIT